jgi:hypothetical protein
MNGVTKLISNRKEIWCINYSNCKEDDMIALACELTELGIAENKPMLVLAIYNEKNFVTPKVMRQFEKVTAKIIHLVDKAAMVGLSPTKKIILKGYNLLFNRNFKAFNTKEEAIAYLTETDGGSVE